MRIIYMGTPDIAVPALESLIKEGHEIVAVVTQPDRAQGRHKELVASPVKVCAQTHDIPVLQPEKARDESFITTLASYKPELIVVMAYGQILTKALLEVPSKGCINIHASLLPKYRGAAPISAVILYGEKETGVTTMYMDEGLDTGDMLLKESIAIDSKETTESLELKVANVGGKLIIDTIRALENGTLKRTKQDESEATYIKMIRKEEGLINWEEPAEFIERRIRAFYPWPGTFTLHKNGRIKVYEAETMDMAGKPGEVLRANGSEIIIGCGKGSLKLISLQSEGKKRMDAASFLRGYKLEVGEVLGE